ncbi:hypothetical protein HELRODRAFT_108264 [Helobdella robusta]|uniref:Uncharacterized protein n=1 Tax=Helobdella robusta TaxID=6412 RepID=T1EEH8_HELRO|nr:hypothetical protein HELRODRAFT_108264 [Helobdella robusta]ESN93059.1 hypothetical protein HELRODRAFT_108264 [Helobdella robusta]
MMSFKAVDGDVTQNITDCVVLDSSYVDKPTLKIDLSKKRSISGMVIVTWQGQGQGDSKFNYKDYIYNLERLDVYTDVDGDRAGAKHCGTVTRLNDALFKSTLHLQCDESRVGRFVFIEAVGVKQPWVDKFQAVLCEVSVYE